MPVKLITTQPGQVVFAPAYDQEPTPQLLVNLDLAQVMYYNENPTVDATCERIPPLGTIGMDGKRDIWAATLASSAALQVSPHATSWTASPAQIAEQIALSGVSLLSNPLVLANQAATAVGAGGQLVTGPLDVTQTGYEIGITLQCNSASLTPFASVQMKWTDSASGLIVGEETWWLAAAATSAQQYSGTGPTKGDTLTITVTNADGSHPLTVALTLTQNSRLYAKDDWRQLTTVAIPTLSNGSYDQTSGILLFTDPTINAGASQTRPICLYAGTVRIGVVTAADPCTIEVSTLADQTGAIAGGIIINQQQIAANSQDNFEVSLPRGNCQLTILNTAGSGSAAFGVTVIAEEP